MSIFLLILLRPVVLELDHRSKTIKVLKVFYVSFCLEGDLENDPVFSRQEKCHIMILEKFWDLITTKDFSASKSPILKRIIDNEKSKSRKLFLKTFNKDKWKYDRSARSNLKKFDWTFASSLDDMILIFLFLRR